MEKQKFQILICDDDPICVSVNKAYVQSYSEQFNKEVCIHEILGMGNKFDELMSNNEMDIAFLDIDLVNGNGFKIASELQKRNPKMPIIFITSYSEYAEDACDIMAMGYLKKPIVQANFERLYERALIQAEANRNVDEKPFLQFIVNRKVLNLRMNDIIYAEKVQRKIIIKMKDEKEYEVIDTMNHIEKMFSSAFLRISQSVIVNRNEIKHYDRRSIRISTGDEFVIGRTYLKKVLDDLKNLNR